MSATAINFLTNDNVLIVVNAYLIAMDKTPFEDQATIIRSILNRYRPKDAAKITGIPLQNIYHYRRKDLTERQSSIPLTDFIKILMLGNADM